MSREWVFDSLELADMTPSNARGSALGAPYALEPRIWLKDIVDAAKKKQQYVPFAIQKDVPKGNKDIVIPRRKSYIGSGTTWSGSVSPGTAVNYTTINVLDGQLLTPAEKNAGVAVTYDTIRTNLVDYVAEAKNQLIYFAGDDVDKAIVDAVMSGTATTSTVGGAQTIFGGDASACSGLSASDAITVDMVAEGKRKLRSTAARYWSGGAEAVSSGTKNPWMPEAGAPFVLAIAPEQEEVFLRDSQFVNASEYGGREIIANGEVGNYLGTTIVVSNNTKAYAASTVGQDGSTTAAAQHTCVMFKSKKAYAIAYGQRPKLRIFDYPRELEKDIILEQAYATATVQNDAIVWINVAD